MAASIVTIVKPCCNAWQNKNTVEGITMQRWQFGQETNGRFIYLQTGDTMVLPLLRQIDFW